MYEILLSVLPAAETRSNRSEVYFHKLSYLRIRTASPLQISRWLSREDLQGIFRSYESACTVTTAGPMKIRGECNAMYILGDRRIGTRIL